MRQAAIVIVLLCALPLAGCGPMMFPAVERLDPQEQAEVDGVWDAMLNPAAKADRQVLLDALLLQQLHQRGVDRLILRSEKLFTGGTAVLEVFFERANEAADRFELTVLDMDNKVARHESWPADEVIEAVRLCWDAGVHREHEPPEARLAREAELEHRFNAVADLLGLERCNGAAPAAPAECLPAGR
jgi:hypothetical protein